MKRSMHFLLVLPFLGLLGCGGGPKIVSVSGVVTLDGKPYPNAIVSFQPVGTKDNPNPGRGSSGLTDASGKYTLTYDGRQPGALVGKHRIRIFTQLGAEPGQDDGAEAPIGRPMARAERIPVEWHEQSEKEFEVPVRGTDKANFDIDTRGRKLP